MVLNRDNTSQVMLSAWTKPEPKFNGDVLHVVDTNTWFRYVTENFGIDAYSEAKWIELS